MEAAAIITRAIEQYVPSHVFGMFSGGNDSLTVTHFAAERLGKRMASIVHINTGIGLPETRQFVGETCERFGWRMLEIHAGKDCGQHYESLVMEFGFPGPPHHTKMYNRLKERALEKLARDFNVKGAKIMLISGLRQQESGRRMKLKPEPIQVQGRRVWCAPFFFLDGDEVQAYRAQNEIPESPVRKYLCMSGECLCGAYARPGELKEIEMWFPETGQRIRELEKKVRAAGFPWGWGEGPPPWWGPMQLAKKFGQGDAFSEETAMELQMLCTSCYSRFEQETEASS